MLLSIFSSRLLRAEHESAPDQVIFNASARGPLKSSEISSRSYLLYNETTYLPQINNAVNEGKLIYQAQDWNSLRPYLGVALGQDLRSDSTLIFNDNHVSPLLGIRYAPRALPYGIYVEFREKMRMVRAPQTRSFSEGDLRAGAYVYQWFNLAQISSGSRVFQELYAETLYTSALQNNIFIQGWLKQGIRNKLHKMVDLDAYVEFAGTYDRTPLPDYHIAYFDLGARANFRLDSFLAQIIFKKPLAWMMAPQTLSFPWSTQLVISGEF